MTDKLNKQVLKNLILPLLVSTVVTVIYNFNDFSWTYIIPFILALPIVAVFEFNKSYLISLSNKTSDESAVELTYYSFLDKIKTENFSRNDIISLKRKKKKILIELSNNRKLELHYLEDSKETLGNIV
jgi:hypothetical protein